MYISIQYTYSLSVYMCINYSSCNHYLIHYNSIISSRIILTYPCKIVKHQLTLMFYGNYSTRGVVLTRIQCLLHLCCMFALITPFICTCTCVDVCMIVVYKLFSKIGELYV